MVTSLSKNQILERFNQRQSQFAEAVAVRMKPTLPFTIESYDDLAGRCALVVGAFVEVIFTEDTVN